MECGGETKELLLISWNVAGWGKSLSCIKAHYKTLEVYLNRHQVDILCIQEVKLSKRRLTEEASFLGAKLDGWDTFWAPCSDSTFNGVATLVRTGLTSRADPTPLDQDELNRQGRCIRTDHKHFVVFNVYCPAASNRLGESFRIRFLRCLRRAMQKARDETSKPVILCGDINIAHKAADVFWDRRGIDIELFLNTNLDTTTKVMEENITDVMRTHLRECQKDLEKNWKIILTALESLEVIEEETSNSITNQKYNRFRTIVEVNGRKVKLGKPFHSKDEALHSYRFDGYKWLDEESEQTGYCYPPGVVGTAKLAELLSMLCGVQWDISKQKAMAFAFGESPSSIPSKQWLESLLNNDKMHDTFRLFYKPNLVYNRFTCWNQYTNARYINSGARIDYVIVDHALMPFVQRGAGLQYGATDTAEMDPPDAALRAATANGLFKAASFAGEGLIEPPNSVNNSQFTARHTGIVYTPPKYSDHVGVSVLLKLTDTSRVQLVRDSKTRLAQPQLEQPSIKSFFGARKPSDTHISTTVTQVEVSSGGGPKARVRKRTKQSSVLTLLKRSKQDGADESDDEVECLGNGGPSSAKMDTKNNVKPPKPGTLTAFFTK